MKKIKVIVSMFCMVALLVSLLPACNKPKAKNTVILFTGNTECAIDHNLGFDGVSEYKKQMQAENENVILADCGGFAVGEQIGTFTKGKCAVDVMNQVGYDYVVPSRGEFMYGLQNAKELLSSLQAEKLACNIKYTGTGTNYLDDVKPYDIKTVGNKKIGFVGVTSPDTAKTSVKAYYEENGKCVYDFGDESLQSFYDLVQNNIDKCKAEGADYVFLITHIGTIGIGDTDYGIEDLVENTNGVQAVMNSSSKAVDRGKKVQNKDKEEVPIVSTPQKLYYIGKVTIAENGEISTDCIYSTQVTDRDENITNYIKTTYETYNKEMKETVANLDFSLTCNNDAGIRAVANQETNLGDFCTDAFYSVADADVVIMNGKGIRGNLPKGEITMGDILNVLPYGNDLYRVEAKGQEILDELEIGASVAMKDVTSEVNESDLQTSVMQTSGMKYTIDTNIETPVVFGENGIADIKNGAPRRVKNVMILNRTTGEYEQLDPNKEYMLVSTGYILKESNTSFDSENAENVGINDYTAVSQYSIKIKDNPGIYKVSAGRINIE